MLITMGEAIGDIHMLLREGTAHGIVCALPVYSTTTRGITQT